MAVSTWACAFICFYVFGLFLETEAAISAWTEPQISGASGTSTRDVPESQPTDTTITTFDVTSDGSSHEYSLVSAVPPFAVSTDGKLIITSALDHEAQETYTLEVKVVDTADKTTTGTATITVTVTDVNEAPTFAKSMTVKRISKGAGTGTNISTAVATDPDDGDVITYSIHSGDSNNDFTIDGSSGVIKTAKVISGTSTDSYVLVIHAADDESPKLTGSTTIAVVVEDCTCSVAASVTPGILLVLFVGLSNIFL